jgi:hypothetical protein
MVIGVISDTHLIHPTKSFVNLVNNLIKDCNLLVHVGDFTSLAVYMFLHEATAGHLVAVYGNMDPPELRKIIPQKKVFKKDGVCFGVIHGWGGPDNIEERIIPAFQSDDVRCIIFGHTHKSVNHVLGETLFFNPGSPTDKYHARENTIGILNVGQDRVSGEIKLLNHDIHDV